MKKFLPKAISLLFIFTLLVGCTNNGGDKSKKNEKNKSQKETKLERIDYKTAGEDNTFFDKVGPASSWANDNREYFKKLYGPNGSMDEFIAKSGADDDKRYVVADKLSPMGKKFKDSFPDLKEVQDDSDKKVQDDFKEAASKAKIGDEVTVKDWGGRDFKFKKTAVIDDAVKSKIATVFTDFDDKYGDSYDYINVNPNIYKENRIMFIGHETTSQKELDKVNKIPTDTPPKEVIDGFTNSSYDKPIPRGKWVSIRTRNYPLTSEKRRKYAEKYPEKVVDVKGEKLYVNDYNVRFNKVTPYTKDPEYVKKSIKESQKVNTKNNRYVVRFKDMNLPLEIEPVIVDYEVYLPMSYCAVGYLDIEYDPVVKFKIGNIGKNKKDEIIPEFNSKADKNVKYLLPTEGETLVKDTDMQKVGTIKKFQSIIYMVKDNDAYQLSIETTRNGSITGENNVKKVYFSIK